MEWFEPLVEEARARGLKPWIAIKQRLAEGVIVTVSESEALVLQGGAALHFAYRSPRLSVDVDFAGIASGRALEQQGEAIARAVGERFGVKLNWSSSRSGRLFRGKISAELGPGRRLVLPIEACEVPAHRPRRVANLGTVEAPEEIAADKVVASADRLARRGTLKLTDLYDLWHLKVRVGATPPRELVAQKLLDYGGSAHGSDLGAAVKAISSEELRSALEGVLPVEALESLAEREVLETAAELLGACRELV